MKDWIKVNILQSRTAWGAVLALIIGLSTWIIFVPKDLGGWVALGTFMLGAIGIWIGANKAQAYINTKNGGDK